MQGQQDRQGQRSTKHAAVYAACADTKYNVLSKSCKTELLVLQKYKLRLASMYMYITLIEIVRPQVKHIATQVGYSP